MDSTLQSRFKSVLSKRRSLTLGVWGEAGIGKSFQVQRLLHSLPCRSQTLHATVPLASFILPKPKKLATWAARILERLGRGEAVEASSILDALGATLASLAPFVLYLEDIHEADTERTSFIQELAKVVLRSKGVALIVTSRKEPPEPFTSIKLEPLTRQETDTLLGQELKEPLPQEALSWIYDRAAGNPLYTLEYLRYLTRQGFLWNDSRAWHWRKPSDKVMPVTVEALIEQLIHQASSEPLQRYVLESKAFLPLNSSDEVWQKIARVDEQELQTAITELVQQGVFRGKEFAHPLFREVTLESMGKERNRHLARRAMNVFQANPVQAALFVEDAGLEPDEALGILKKAAEQTKEHNEVEAAKFLAKAVNYATGEEKSTLALEAAKALQHQDVPKAIAFVEQLLGEEPNNLEALYLGTFLYALDAQEAKAKQLFSQLPSAECESQRGIEMLLEIYRALDKFDDFLTTWEQNKTRLPAIESNYLYFVVVILSQRAKPREAITLAKTSLERSDLPINQRTRLMNSLGLAYMDAGQHEQALDVFNQLIDGYATHLNTRRLTGILHNRALSKTWLGYYAEAKIDITQSYQLANESGSSYGIARALTMLSNVMIELAQYEGAETYLTHSLELLQKRHLTPHVVDAEVNLCTLYLCWQLPHSGILALKHAYAALACAREVEDAYSMIDGLFTTTLVEARYGSATKALELANELEPLAERNGTPIDSYYAAWAKAKALKALEHLDDSKVYFQKAYETAQQVKHDLMANKLGLELDLLNNDIESARRRMQWFEERGLMNGVNIAKRYFPELADTKEVTPLTTSIRLEVLGSLQITKKTTSSIRGRKRQELLALLLEARISGKSEVSRLTLLDALYSEEDELKASSSLKGVVHYLRDTLGNNAVLTTTNGYALGECNSDAEEFLQTGDTTLWRGSYLEGVELSEESSVEGSLYLLLFEKAKALLENNPDEAARVGGLLVEAEPYNTDYLKTYLTALRLSNNHRKLARHYEDARERLLEVGETLPETWQGFLAKQ